MMFLALEANPSVDLVCSLSAGVTVQMMVVRELPPRESFRIRVSFESGTMGVCKEGCYQGI